MKKYVFHIVLMVLLALSMALPAHAASQYTTDASKVKGGDFTDIPALSEKLDGIFSGTLRLYSDIHCRTQARAPLGSRAAPLGVTYYVKSSGGTVYSGTSCYIYANAVYETLFGDVPFHGDDVGWDSSERVAANLSSASYEAFRKAGVGFGALLRTTKNADGSYNGDAGHSVIILKYDHSGLTYLEGNGDGQGLIRVTTRDWDSFNSVSVTGRGYRISFIVQPTGAYMDSLYSGAVSEKPDYVGYFRKNLTYAGHFRDVPGGAWYANAVRRAYETGMVNGESAELFAPNGKVTAAEAVTLAARYLSLYYADGHCFTGSGAWYRPYYDYLAVWGIDAGQDNPDAPIKRSEFARLLARVLPDGAAGGSKAVSFPDVPASASYAASVDKLAQNGIVAGSDDGLFHPDSNLTRAEMAQIVARMVDRSMRVK